MVRMILAHPRSRSHLLGSSYENYVSELFSPLYISGTEFYRENKDLLAQGSGPDAPFADAYIEHLRQTYQGKDFVFKAHFCSIKGWRAARNLIAEWKPEVIACHRADKQMAVLSYLIALHNGFTSFHKIGDGEPFVATRAEFDRAWTDVVEDWDAGLQLYKPEYWYEYDGIPDRIQIKQQFNPEGVRTFLANCKYKEQHSKRKLFLISNLKEVCDWWDERAKERIKNAFAAITADNSAG